MWSQEGWSLPKKWGEAQTASGKRVRVKAWEWRWSSFHFRILMWHSNLIFPVISAASNAMSGVLLSFLCTDFHAQKNKPQAGAAGVTDISLLLPLAWHQAVGAPPQIHWQRTAVWVSCANCWPGDILISDKHDAVSFPPSQFRGRFGVHMSVYRNHILTASSRFYESSGINLILIQIRGTESRHKITFKGNQMSYPLIHFWFSITMVLFGTIITTRQCKYSERRGVSETRCSWHTTANWAQGNKLLALQSQTNQVSVAVRFRMDTTSCHTQLQICTQRSKMQQTQHKYLPTWRKLGIPHLDPHQTKV